MTTQKNQQKVASDDKSVKKLTVFVSGLNYHTTEEEITNFFAKCGKIERINLAKKENSAHNQGFCHIIYQDEEGYQRALALNGSKLDGRYLDIITAKGPTKIDKIKDKLKSSKNVTLFVRNIPYDTTEQEINELFVKYGTIKAIRLPLCRDDPTKLKGICFIDFEDPKNLIKALELDGYSLRGRYLKLDADISYDDATGTKIKSKNPNQNQVQSQVQGQVPQQVPQQMMAQNDPSYMLYYQNAQSWQNYGNYVAPQQQPCIPPPGFQPEQQQYGYQYQNGYVQYPQFSHDNNAPQVAPNSQESHMMNKTQYAQEFANFDAIYDPKAFEHLSRRNYSGIGVPEYQMAEQTIQDRKAQKACDNKRRDSDFDGIVDAKAKLRTLIDEDMSKELEEFRNNNNLSAKSSTEYKISIGSLDGNIFADAVLGLDNMIQKSTKPIDNVLNPFQKSEKDAKAGKNSSGDKQRDLAKFLPSKLDGGRQDYSKKLAKFVAAPEKASPKASGFSLSRFWKKN